MPNPYSSLKSPFAPHRPHKPAPKASGLITVIEGGPTTIPARSAAPAGKFTPSDEQLAVIECQSPFIVVNSFAGTGKTTTGQAFSAARPKERFLYLCLNKANQLEAQARFGPNVVPMTTHAAALSKMRGHVGRRIENRWDPLSFMESMKIQNYREAAATQQVLKSFFASTDKELDEKHVLEAENKWGLTPREKTNCFAYARLAWRYMQDPAHTLPIPHDSYLKMFALTSPKLDFDWIIFDEAQDANPLTAQIIQRQHNVKILCIGDRHQAIYGFRGAINAMELFSSMPGAQTLNLTKTWRFGHAIAAIATTLLHEIKGETATIKGMGTPGKWTPEKVTLLARTNAHLFKEAAAVHGRGVHWLGGIDNYRVSVVLDAYALFQGRSSAIQDPFLKKFRSWGEFVDYGDSVRDPEPKMLKGIIEEYRADTVSLANAIRANAVDDPAHARTILTTAHKSKGLDWDCVRVCPDFELLQEIEDHFVDSPQTPLSQEHEQELNLLYVSITRARKAVALNQETSDWLKDLPTHRAARVQAANLFKRALQPRNA